MKVVIIGASHSGLAAADTLLSFDPTIEVTLIDSQDQASLGYFASGLNFGLNNQVADLTEVTTSVTDLLERGIQLKTETLVLDLDDEAKRLRCQQGEKTFSLDYDKLIVAVGSSVFDQTSLSQENENVIAYKTLAQSLHALQVLEGAKRVVIIGAGYISLELANVLVSEGTEVHLVDSMDAVLFRYFDEVIASQVVARMTAAGVHYHRNAHQVDFQREGGRVSAIVIEDEVIPVDVVVTPLPARPNTEFLMNVLELHDDMTVKVNDYLQTSDPDIYAVGDIVASYLGPSAEHVFMPLVGRAVRLGRAAALNVAGVRTKYGYAKKLTASQMFGCFLGSCGLTSEEAPFFGFEAEAYTGTLRIDENVFQSETGPEFTCRLVYEKGSHMVLGMQLISETPLIELLNTFSGLTIRPITLESLAVEEFTFLPTATGRFHILNQIAYQALLQENQQGR